MPSNSAAASPAPRRTEGRPFALDPLFRALTTLSGVGPKTLPALARLLGGEKIIDLLWHKPIDLIDRSYRPALRQLEEGRIATVTITVERHTPPRLSHLPYRITASDGTGFIELVFFHVKGNWIEQQYPFEKPITVSGKVEKFQGKWQMMHPDKLPDDLSAQVLIEPIYPLTHGVTNKQVNKCIHAALGTLPALPEWMDTALQTREKWPAWTDAVQTLHRPRKEQDLLPYTPARKRLAYDELLASQITVQILRGREKVPRGRVFTPSTRLRPAFLKLLPFNLTSAQQRSVAEIDADMAAPERMMRLLQGDVGSGKTVVAALAMLNAIEGGAQAAIMAPTEILAQQHAQTLTPLFEKLGISTVVLTGRVKGRERDEILTRIANGAVKAIIGTHALFQDDVAFADLGLTVVDEQHRFGVHQRLKLSKKGYVPDLLVMTATPIPRTLTLAVYGDLDISRLDEKPPGRKPIDTRLIGLPHLEDLIAGVGKEIGNGVQVYWVCPLVEESEILDLAAAEERHRDLQTRFGAQVGLIHGRMKPAEKDAVMSAFAAGAIKLLVATTVIEVGVNVPNATVMVIEHAERYGLAQLHQLRGRVGRGEKQSYCFLLYTPDCTVTAKERLKTMRETEDGFLIAERDLKLRGPGDILGTKQSGVPEFRLADLGVHGDLLEIARDDARVLLNKDPKLETERGQAVRHLLYLFERDQAIRLLQAG